MRVRFVPIQIFNIIIISNIKLGSGGGKLENNKNLNGNDGPRNGIFLETAARVLAKYSKNGGKKIPGKRLDDGGKKYKQITV